MALICPEKILCIPAEEIFRHYGFEHQVGKTREEIDELLEAINGASYWWKNGMPISDESRAALLTECADVIVMCAQLLRLDAVLYPVNMEPSIHGLRAALISYGVLLSEKQGPMSVGLHLGRDIIDETIRLAVSITGKEELQEEILFKIRRQEERIAVEQEAAKAREEAERKRRAAARAVELEAKRAAKNAAKVAASTKKRKTA